VVDFVFADPLLHSGGLNVSREEIEAQLTAVGFTPAMLEVGRAQGAREQATGQQKGAGAAQR
jgi:hypothetical protein